MRVTWRAPGPIFLREPPRAERPVSAPRGAVGAADSPAAEGAGRGCRPRSALQPQVGSRCPVPGLDGSRATGTERRVLRG